MAIELRTAQDEDIGTRVFRAVQHSKPSTSRIKQPSAPEARPAVPRPSSAVTANGHSSAWSAASGLVGHAAATNRPVAVTSGCAPAANGDHPVAAASGAPVPAPAGAPGSACVLAWCPPRDSLYTGAGSKEQTTPACASERPSVSVWPQGRHIHSRALPTIMERPAVG